MDRFMDRSSILLASTKILLCFEKNVEYFSEGYLMNRKLKVIISVIAVIIGLVIIKNSLPLNRKANEVFGNV